MKFSLMNFEEQIESVLLFCLSITFIIVVILIAILE